MADAESSRILRKQNCVLTEATRELAISAIQTPICSSCPLSITAAPVPPYQDCIITIDAGSKPFAIATSSDTAWVLNQGNDGDGAGISRIDENIVTASIYLQNPQGIALDPANTYVWVTAPSGVYRINTSSNILSGPIIVGSFPIGIVVSPDNSTVWVVNNGSNTVSYIDVASLTVSGSIPVVPSPTQIVISSDNLYVYVVHNSLMGKVSRISTLSKTVIGTINVGSGPSDIAISSDNSKLWIANKLSNTVSVLNSISGALLVNIPISYPIAIAISPDSSVWITSIGTLTQFNSVTYTQIATYSIPDFLTGVAVTPDNTAVLVANASNVIKLYNPYFRVEGLPVPSSGTALLLLTIIHGRAVDLTSYVQAADGSPLTFILPLNIGGSVEINGSILTAYQTTPYLPITVTTSSYCTQVAGSMTLNVVLTVPAFVTPKESNYTLSKIAACPLYTLNQIPLNPCLTVAPTFTPPVLETPSPLNPYPYVTTPPSALHQYRSVPRIRSINQIATVVRGQSASEATIRKQTATLQGNKAPTTTFFRKPVPLPPCIPRFVRPPPYPPAPPCRTKPL
jgi:YVTN family beta-propeller protein